jgi:raffinose/stachyose/melibiose transport system permease protein
VRHIGLANFRKILFADPIFWRSLLNALLLAAVTLAIQNPVAFFVAALLTKLPQKRSRPFRTVFFIPAVLSLVVVTKLWVNIFSPNYGLLNKALDALGLKILTTAWLTNIHTALWSVIFIVIWQGFGWALLFYFSGLMTVPRELEEAAMIDGASGLSLYGRIVIPYLLPVIQAVAVIGIISCLKQMEIVYLSTNGAPGDTTQFIANYVYIKAFTYSQYGYGNALSVLFVVIAVALTAVTQRSTRRLPEM